MSAYPSFATPPISLALLLALGAHAGAQAQGTAPVSQGPDGMPLSTFKPVIVSAMPLEREGNSVTSPVTILDDADLLLRRNASLGNTLDGVPGINANTFGAGASRPVIRGQDAPRVKVLSDGSELLDASAVSPDHAIAGEPMLARQIEVLRGPSTLLYGGGASGGVVNVLDNRVPTQIPDDGIEGSVELRGNTGARERTGAFGVTAGAGNLAVHVEGLKRRSDDYEVPDWETSRLQGSYNDTSTGSIGLSWVTALGYTGIAFTSQRNEYGLPGHTHEYEDCHPHGSHLHCGGHGHDDHDGHDHAHDHDHAAAHASPYVDLHSKRWDLRSEYRDPLPGFSRVRVRAGATDYQHSEIDEGETVSAFRNKGYDARVELEHAPLFGWRGLIGGSTLRSDFTTSGTEAFMPRTVTRNHAVFLVEEYELDDWRFEAGARHDWQRIKPSDAQPAYSDGATSLSAAALWRFAPQYSIGLAATRSQRLPVAQELYSRGIHMATNTYEIGDPDLQKETSHNIDLTLRKHQGDTTFELSAFHNRIRNYIHAHTLDQHEDFRLIRYAQRDADFTGVEGRISQWLNTVLSASLWGDYVRARFRAGDGDLPRIPAARLGLSLQAHWQAWSGGIEFYRAFAQDRIASYEVRTPGYNMLNAAVSYRNRDGGTDYEVYLRADNLLDSLALNHASFLSHVAPLQGRSLTLGVRATF